MSKRDAVIAVVLWSTVASAFKLSLRYMSPVALLFWAFLTSLVLYGLLYARNFRISRENLSSSYLGLTLLLYYLVLFSAYDVLPAQEAQALNYTWPLVLVLLSVPLLGNSLGKRTLVGLLLGFFGALVVATRGNPLSFEFSNPGGVLLGLGSAVIWAIYWILNVRDGRKLDEKMFWNFAFALIYSLPLALPDCFRTSWRGLVGAVYVGLFEMGVTYLLWHRAIEGDVAFASGLAYLVPFLSLFFILIVIGESIAPATVLGLIMIVGGIMIGKSS